MRKIVEFRVSPHQYSKSLDCDPSLEVICNFSALPIDRSLGHANTRFRYLRDVLSDSLKEYISDKFGSQNAWRYTVTQPAINAILQAMGRPIRSVDDRALVLLLDNRNDNRTYRECYPHAMKMNTSNDPNSTKAFAKRFFRRVKRG